MKRAKYHTLQAFDMDDVAEAAGVHLRTLQRKCKILSIDPKKLSLVDLVDLINNIKALKGQ